MNASSALPPTGDDAPVLHRRDARGVHWLTLNQPRSFNVLSEDVLQAMQRHLAEIAADERARALVIAAEGRAFCAGHDLKQMSAHPRLDYYQQLFAQCSKVMLAIAQLPVPVIARVQGLATAAGCQLVAQCDLAVAADSARFGVNGIGVGLFCATPAVPLSRAVPVKTAMEMLVTGSFLDAHEALARGLINRVASAERLDAELESLLQAIVSKPREALAVGKRCFYQQRELGIEAAYQLAGQSMACNMMLDVTQEGVQAFINKREPAWQTAI